MPTKETQEEYELVPLAPIRRLEKRIDELEATKGVDPRNFLKEIVDIIKMNQQLVDEMARANDSLRIELSRIPGRLEELTNNLGELISYIKSASEETGPGVSGESIKPLLDKLDQLIETNKKIVESNQNMLTSLDDISKKLKRPFPPLPIRKPLLPPKPV